MSKSFLSQLRKLLMHSWVTIFDSPLWVTPVHTSDWRKTSEWPVPLFGVRILSYTYWSSFFSFHQDLTCLFHSLPPVFVHLQSTRKHTRTCSQKPSEMNKISFTRTPSLPRNEQKFALQASTLRPECMQKTFWTVKWDFYEPPPPPKKNEFLRFIELLWTFAIAIFIFPNFHRRESKTISLTKGHATSSTVMKKTLTGLASGRASKMF